MNCPYCAEVLPGRTDVCPYCDSDLRQPTRRPVSHTGGDSAGLRMILPVGRSGWAIAAGYLGLISVLAVPGPFAILCSVLAFRDMKQNPKLHGMGRAVFGMIMGCLGTLVLLIGIVVVLANPK